MRKLITAVSFALAFVLAGASAHAGTITFVYNNEFSGADTPEGTPPFLKATFTDVAGGVELKMEAVGLVETEFASLWYFNVDPLLALPTVSFVSGIAAPVGGITIGTNCCKADGDGKYDIRFNFGSGDLGAGETSVYKFTGVGLTAASFIYLSSPDGGSGPFYTAAHVQSIDSPAGEGEGSGWLYGTPDEGDIPVPEGGATLSLIGIGMLALAFVRMRLG